MPIYEYACEHCGVFEEMQRITDPPLAKCPKCKRKVRRLISQTSFQLKGSGWYVTDYARKGNGGGTGKKDDASGGTSASDGKSEGGTKSDSGKADAKTETKSSAGPGAKSES
jgi:putative FmdB family regulatory protein